MMRRSHPRAAFLLGLALALTWTGCSDDEKSAPDDEKGAPDAANPATSDAGAAAATTPDAGFGADMAVVPST